MSSTNIYKSISQPPFQIGTWHLSHLPHQRPPVLKLVKENKKTCKIDVPHDFFESEQPLGSSGQSTSGQKSFPFRIASDPAYLESSTNRWL